MQMTGDETTPQKALVEFREIGKTYPNGTIALRNVSFQVIEGDILAVCGENGAGKSTLMKILAGIEQPTQGTIHYEGRQKRIADPNVAGDMGIGMVHQHFSLIRSLSVAENLALGQEPRRGLLIDRRAAADRVRELAQKFSLDVDPDTKVGSLSVAAQQKVEILKALSRNTRLLILDEPSAVLTPQETQELFVQLRSLRARGVTIIFISHKLHEVRALANRITVIRSGEVVEDGVLSEMSDAAISRLVMGVDVTRACRNQRDLSAAAPVVVVKKATVATGDSDRRIEAIDLTISAGEILGIAGVDGSGQEGVVDLLCGNVQPDEGDISLLGRPMALATTLDWRRAGMAHLPGDRFQIGGAPHMSLVDNVMAGSHRDKQYTRGPFLRIGAMVARTNELIKMFNVRCLGPREPLNSLSGGNAQKLVAAREFSSNPKFLIVNQPTRGIDVAAAAMIHGELLRLSQNGTAILLVTSDLDELLQLSDRVAVMFDGGIAVVLENDGLTPERLGPYMLGLEIAS